jgi:hypothetical protein
LVFRLQIQKRGKVCITYGVVAEEEGAVVEVENGDAGVAADMAAEEKEESTLGLQV